MRVTVVLEDAGRQSVAITDGARQLRLDVEGSVTEGPVRLEYQLAGFEGVEARIQTLRRLIALRRLQRFPAGLEYAEPKAKRWMLILRAHDLAQAGLSHRRIAVELFGADRVAAEWRTSSDSMRLQVQRLLRDARNLVQGGYLGLLAKSSAFSSRAQLTSRSTCRLDEAPVPRSNRHLRLAYPLRA